MKKLMYIAAALLVLVGCNKKDNIVENAPEGTPFEKGQQVTLTVGTGAQQGPNKVAGVDNTAQNRIDFTWEEGDQILIKVGDKTAEFTLSSEPGLEYGEFAGVMPAGGSTFDIQYPTTTPDLSTQEYTALKTIPADKMSFAASNCTLDNDAFLTAQNAMVQLNLFGTDKTVGKIVFTNKTADPAESYTLTLPEGGVEISANSEEATPFYMVVPAGAYKFEVEVYDNAETPAMICSFATSEAKAFTAGECLNMPAKEVKEPFVPTYVDLGLPSGVKWATCNVGATKPEEYGDYFAWGEVEPYYSSQDPLTWKTGKESGYAWQSYCGQSSFQEWSTAPYDANKILLLTKDAAHVNWEGDWRMPTKAEFEELRTKCEWTWTQKNGINGYEVKGPNDNTIFLPAADYRSDLLLYGEYGQYWSSSLQEYSDPNNAYILYFRSGHIDDGGMRSHRCDGLSVRPVCQ